jgi:hypothetical protein
VSRETTVSWAVMVCKIQFGGVVISSQICETVCTRSDVEQ